MTSLLSARSRKPIDEAAITWWNLNENSKNASPKRVETATKSTNTESEFITKIKANPKEIVLQKWRERHSKANYELVRKAVINSIKEKIQNTKHRTIASNLSNIKEDNAKTLPTIIITNADVEETSNLNMDKKQRRNLDSVFDDLRVEGFEGDGLDVGHASRFQMELGSEVAQYRPLARDARAGAAEIRGLLDMPVSFVNFVTL
ncbi:unnamed protein product [Pieris macdunnoughi]|uniref:Uncharacterized protein n=1 Tax=Pieris macdunnoughi TaxID=345717 RepID=A0A821VIS2_9NEOP|nr:unnamed protein product [Pieris macdunnoughi]